MYFNVQKITDWSLPRDARERYIRSFMDTLGYKFLGQGRMRITYLSHNGRYVLKFPTSSVGLEGNRSEAKRYARCKNNPDPDNNGAVYAPCRLIQGTVLMMHAVVKSFGISFGCQDAKEEGRMQRLNVRRAPSWVKSLDCNQAGILPNGRVVAFDYTE